MITRISGTLSTLVGTEARLDVGPFEYQVLIPEFVRRQLQPLVGQTVQLRTIEYLEGNPQSGRLTPRLVGFMSEAEQEFFEMVCSVDGVGVKKALRAMVRPVREVATAIEEQDIKQLSTLPGVGPAVAERIVAKLRRKMTKFALMVSRGEAADVGQRQDVFADAYDALLGLGHSASDARKKIEQVSEDGKKSKSVKAILPEIYRHQHK